MNRLILAAAATLALTGAASAMTSASLQNEVNGYVSGVDLDSLTDAQVNAIKLSVHSGDSSAEVRSFIQSIIRG